MQAQEPDQRVADATEENGKNSPAVGYQPGIDQGETTPDKAKALTRKSEVEQQAARARMKGSHPGDRYVRVARQAPTRPIEGLKPEHEPKPKRRQAGPLRRWLLQGECARSVLRTSANSMSSMHSRGGA